MKKLLSMLLSLTTLLGLLPAAALAAEPAEISGAEVTVVQEGLGSVYDVLPASYGLSGLSVVESTEFSWDAETGRGYYYQLDENSKLVYDAILASGLKDGPTDAMVSIAGLSNTWNQSFNITVTDEWSLADKADQDMVSAWVTSVTTPALLALIYDHPELSWLVNTTTKLSYGGATTDTVYDNTTCISNYTVQQISVGKEVINDYGDLNALITVVNDMTDAIDQKIGTAATTYQRIGAIHDDICELVTYTTDADLEKDLYQTVYSALVDGSHATVCVGYAKAFKMLCDAYQIPCVLVSGDVDGDPKSPTCGTMS